MQELMTWYRNEAAKGDMHLVEVAARFHHRFTAIHPFDDGNGRMSRLLMNLMLMQSGYVPAVIRIGERNRYLTGLRGADQGEYDEFISFVGEHVAESLELALRGINGEEIDEPADIEKEIALEVLRLRHIEEPQLLTNAAQQTLFVESLNPLLVEIARLLAPLCELFAENTVSITGGYTRTLTPQPGYAFQLQLPILDLSMIPRPTDGTWTSTSVFSDLRLNFSLNGFKRARFDTFNVSGGLEIVFESLKYRLVEQTGLRLGLQTGPPPFAIQHFYQDKLSKEERQQVAQKIVRFFLDTIKKKTNGPA